MRDGIIKEDGTSRLVRGNFPASYEAFRAQAAAGTLTLDLLFHATGWDIQPTFLNKGTLLSAATEAALGFTNSQVDYTVDGLARGQETREDGGEDIFQALPICLNMADGSVLELDNLGGGLTPQGDKTLCQWGGLYPHVVDLEQVDSVTIGTVTIPVPGV